MCLVTTAVPMGLPERKAGFQSRATMSDWHIICNQLPLLVF